MPILNTAQNDLTNRTRALYLPLRNPNFCSEGLPVLVYGQLPMAALCFNCRDEVSLNLY